jgi:hypothetical protein
VLVAPSVLDHLPIRLIEMLDKVLGQAKYAAAERRQLDIT